MSGTEDAIKHQMLKDSHKELMLALEGLHNIINDSTGVSGYNAYGEEAEWDTFEEVQTSIDVLKNAKQL